MESRRWSMPSTRPAAPPERDVAPGRSAAPRVRGALALALALTGLLSSAVVAPPASALDGTETAAPVIKNNWTVPNEVWNGDFADPSVVRVGTKYYAHATNTAGRYVPTLVSDDLVSWRAHPGYSTSGPPGTKGYSVSTDTAIPVEFRTKPWSETDRYNNNDALVKPASWGQKTSDGPWVTSEYWAPAALQIGTTWYLYSAVRVQGERFCLTVASGPSPLGPFRDDTTGPIQCQPVNEDPEGSIDPFGYTDPASGKNYLMWKALGKVNSHPSSIQAVEVGKDGRPLPGVKPTKLLATDERGWEGTTIENPSMVRYGGATYLFYSGNHWGVTDDAGRSDYATGYALCPAGPTAPCQRPSDAPLLSSSGTAQGPGGSSAFLDAAGALRLASATYFLGENRIGEAITHPRRMSIATLVQNADKTLSVVPGTGPVGPRNYALGGPGVLPDGVVGDATRLTGRHTVRLQGADRLATSAVVAQTFTSAPRAYLALGANFPDALSAAAAAGAQKSPVLLVTKDSVTPGVLAELARLKPSRVSVVGGPSVISGAVLDQARSATGATVDRIAGQDRYETAARVSSDFRGRGSSTVYVASGEGFADALSASSAAALNGSPVLLTQRGMLPAATREALSGLKPTTVVVVGGPTVVQDPVLGEIRALLAAAKVERVAGNDRYGTAAAVLARVPRPTSLWLASGTNFPDALSGAAAAAAQGSVMVIVPPTGITEPQRSVLRAAR